jgi:hypothetical protein
VKLKLSTIPAKTALSWRRKGMLQAVGDLKESTVDSKGVLDMMIGEDSDLEPAPGVTMLNLGHRYMQIACPQL